MNIGILIWHYQTGWGGLENVTGTVARLLTEKGHSVHIFYNTTKDEPLIQPAYRHPERLCHDLRLDKYALQLERARELISRQNLDVFVAHFSWHDMLWVPPLLHNLGIPLVYAEHSDPVFIQNERWNRPEHLACASAADRIVLLFEAYKAAYPEFLQQRISVIPDTVPRPSRQAAPEKPADGVYTLLAAGRFVETIKQFSLLLAAFAALAPAFPDWRLRLCGDGVNMRDYKALAAAFGMADKVSFPGAVSDMSAAYAQANLFCIPSRYEGFGLATAEAQSHGLPAVGFAGCSGTNSLIRHEHNGMLAPEMTAASLAATLRLMMKNHRLRALMGKNAQKDAERFFPETIVGRWETLLADVSLKHESTKLEFPLDRSEEAKTALMLQTVLLRENPFSPSSVFSTLEEQHEITVPPLPDQPVLLAFYRREDKGNLGDELSPYIVKKLTKRKIISVPRSYEGKLCAVRSLLDERTLNHKTTFWGTGTHYPEIMRKKAENTVFFRAVRGPLTREIVKAAGYVCPAVYGDPALLLPQFFQPAKREKKYTLGVIPHFIYHGLLDIKDDVKFINILRNSEEIESFVEEVCACEMVLSSSLHGVIVANAYGVPARYFQVAGTPLMGREGLKFADYFKSVRMPVQKPLMFTNGSIIDAALSKHIDQTVDLKIDLELLQDVFPWDMI